MPIPGDPLQHIFANQVSWLSCLAVIDGGQLDSTWSRNAVTACAHQHHGHLLVPDADRFTISVVDAGLDWLRSTAIDRTLIWTDRDNRDLDIALVSRGCADSWSPRWMMFDLSQPLPDLPLPGTISIVPARLEDIPELESAGGIPYVNIEESRAVLAPAHRDSIWVFLAREHRRPEPSRIVGHVTVFLPPDGSGWAGLYNLGVLPEVQRRGIGSALTVAGCRVVRDQGARVISLNATPDGEHAYRKVGFQVVGDGRTWYLTNDALRDGPHRETIDWAERLARGEIDDLNPALATFDSMPNQESPLMFATRFGEVDAARWLIRHGATPEIVPLWKLGLRDEAMQLLADRSAVNHVSQPGSKSPLHFAVELNDAALAGLLLANGADLTLRDSVYGGTPLDWANAIGGRHAIAELIRT